MDELKNYMLILSDSYDSESNSKSNSPVIGLKPKNLFPERKTDDKIEGINLFPINCGLIILFLTLCGLLVLNITYVYTEDLNPTNISHIDVIVDESKKGNIWINYIENCCVSQNNTHFLNGCKAYGTCEDLINQIDVDKNTCCYRYGEINSGVNTYCDFICLNTRRSI